MKLMLATICLGIGISSMAQNDKGTKYMPMASKSLGVSFQKFDGLNSRLAGLSQYESLKDYAGTIGLGWMKERNRVISAGGVTLASSMSGDRDKRSSAIRYAGINADIGYDVIKNERIMLYPMVGLGVQGYEAVFHKDNSGVAFDDVLESPAVQNDIRSVKFKNAFVVYRLGLGVAFSSAKYPSSSIGLQGGYSGSFKSRTWRSNENQLLADAPDDKLEQFYAALVFTCKPWFK